MAQSAVSSTSACSPISATEASFRSVFNVEVVKVIKPQEFKFCVLLIFYIFKCVLSYVFLIIIVCVIRSFAEESIPGNHRITEKAGWARELLLSVCLCTETGY